MKSSENLVLIAALCVAGTGGCALSSGVSVDGAGRSAATATATVDRQDGIAYVSWWHGDYLTSGSDTSLSELQATGANWISLLATQYQDTIDTTTIYPTNNTPTDADLVHAIGRAHSLGFRVMLKPHVDLANDSSHWRGDIGTNYTDTQWTAWFASYQTMITHYAQIARDNSVEQFCVGCELVRSESRSSNWIAIINQVKTIYTGPMTYACNHGSETAISWWGDLDFIGVDAYYPLTNKNNPTVAELIAAWTPYMTTLQNLSASTGKLILFTEIGYCSQDGANKTPWSWTVSATIDLQEQADCYSAFFQTVYQQPWFKGVYWWDWDTNPNQGGPSNSNYTPHGKPAETILSAYYQSAAEVKDWKQFSGNR